MRGKERNGRRRGRSEVEEKAKGESAKEEERKGGGGCISV